MTYSVPELATIDASIETVQERGNVLSVRFSNDERYFVSNTQRNRLLFKHRLFDSLDVGELHELSDDPYVAVRTEDYRTFNYYYGDDDHPITLTESSTVTALLDAVQQAQDTASLRGFETVENLVGQDAARQVVVNAVAAKTDIDVRVLSTGWVIGERFYLRWDGSLRPYSGDPTAPDMWGTADVDSGWFEFTLPRGDNDEYAIVINDNGYDVRPRERLFLRAASFALNYDDHYYDAYWENQFAGVASDRDIFNVEAVAAESAFNETGPVMQFARLKETRLPDDGKVLPDPESVVGAAGVWTGVTDDEITPDAYTAHTTYMHHSHSPSKHDLHEMFNVAEWVIRQMEFPPDDHAAPHELLARQEEFVDDGRPVFTDTDNNDENRWADIEQSASAARIEPETRTYIVTRFGEDGRYVPAAEARWR